MRKLLLTFLIVLSSSVFAQNRTPKTEDNGSMHWVLLEQNGCFGAEDSNGKIIVPISDGNEELVYLCPRVTAKANSSTEVDVNPSFAARKGELWALYDFTGTSGWRFKTSISPLPPPKVYTKNDGKILKEDIKTVSEQIKQNPTAEAFYRRAWIYKSQNKFDEAFTDYANALMMDDCSALMAAQCLTMTELCERLYKIKVESRKAIWASVLEIVPEIECGVTKIASLFVKSPVPASNGDAAAPTNQNPSSEKKDKIWSECPGCKGAKVCPDCNGTGKYSYSKDGKCHRCNGRGTCPTCKGKGGEYI